MNRLRYFDMLKGLAIFLVVMGHVLSICIRGIDRAATFKIIGEVHMPLFFFISGWLAMRSLPDGSPKPTPLWPKAKRLLLPALVVSLLWVWYYPSSGLQSPFSSDWFALLADEWKYGYWFTPVLFVIFLLYIPSARLFGREANLGREVLVVLLGWGILFGLSALCPAQVASYLSLGLICRFYPVFMAGAIARRHSAAFNRLVANPWAVSVAIVVFVLTISYVAWYWRYPFANEYLTTVLRVVMQLAVALIGIAVVKPWSEKAFGPEAAPGLHRMARMWEYIGTRSLAVYLLHYFFLFPLGAIRPWLEATDLAMTPLLVVSAAVAACVVGIVLIVDYILSFAGPMSLLLTGTVQANKQTAK